MLLETNKVQVHARLVSADVCLVTWCFCWPEDATAHMLHAYTCVLFAPHHTSITLCCLNKKLAQDLERLLLRRGDEAVKTSGQGWELVDAQTSSFI
jgi:hypothetical protein